MYIHTYIRICIRIYTHISGSCTSDQAMWFLRYFFTTMLMRDCKYTRVYTHTHVRFPYPVSSAHCPHWNVCATPYIHIHTHTYVHTHTHTHVRFLYLGSKEQSRCRKACVTPYLNIHTHIRTYTHTYTHQVPVPRIKRALSSQECLCHIVQLILAGDPVRDLHICVCVYIYKYVHI